MLHVRLHHGVIAVLLHVGVLALCWGSKAVTSHTTGLLAPAGVVTAPPLPQRLVVTLPALPGAEPSGEGDGPERMTPIDYAAAAPQQEPAVPDLSQPAQATDAAPAAPDAAAGRHSLAERPDYDQYLQEVLAPALESPSLTGVRAPAYVVQGLDDGLVQDMVRTGHARLVVQASTDFFVYEEAEGHTTWRRITALPGYAQRALRLRSTLSLALAQRIHHELGFRIENIAVLVVPSVAFDRLILAKQLLAAQQLGTPLAEIRVTEGYLRRHGQAFTFLVERARLTNGLVRSLEDGERRFLTTE
jgi:hypothetical protein